MLNENYSYRYEQTVEIKDLDINLNGIQGVDAILDMIKDTIDNGDTRRLQKCGLHNYKMNYMITE